MMKGKKELSDSEKKTTSQRRSKKIMSEIVNFKKNQLFGIYPRWNEDNFNNIYCLIIGPKGSPYEDGFFIFHFNLIENYPFEPPNVTCLSCRSTSRINPNLYSSGKVCISILNTWTATKTTNSHTRNWSPVMNINSVCLSIQTEVLNDTPLLNEPGYDNRPKEEYFKYNLIVEQETLLHTVCGLLKNPHPLFKEIMIDHFLANFKSYIDRVNVLIESKEDILKRYGKDGKITVRYVVNTNNITLNYEKILEELLGLYTKFTGKEYSD